MAEKTPRELLRETLERTTREVATWPAWMRRAVSTEAVFEVRGGTVETPRRTPDQETLQRG